MGKRTVPNRILGIDFSGATDAGRKIWVTQARVTRGKLVVEACADAVTLLGCDAAPEAACAALVEFLGGLGPCAVGCDFPFSLPAAMIPDRTWPALLQGFARRYPTAEHFHAKTHHRWGELHRPCDVEAKTPFAPNNLRLYRQTYYGIRDVLTPLVASGAACVLPLQRARAGLPWLLECCPASALKPLGVYKPPYKGAGPARQKQRGAILNRLVAEGVVIPLVLRRTMLAQAGGDALDSLVAAWIAWRAVAQPGALYPKTPGWAASEGYVYA